MQELNDPEDGKPVVDHIFRREDIFWGPNLDKAPDLVLIMRDLSYNTHMGFEFSQTQGGVISHPKSQETGSHRLDGVLIAAGPHIRRANAEIRSASLQDISPTVLNLLGVPISKDIDGKVLDELIVSEYDPDYISIKPGQVPSEPSVQYSEAEEEEVIERLKQLGYLE